jgi:hypothetical protein
MQNKGSKQKIVRDLTEKERRDMVNEPLKPSNLNQDEIKKNVKEKLKERK